MSVLAIDAGTTGVTALVVDEAGVVLAQGYREFPQYFPQDGWVEHDPEQIWAAALAATQDALGSVATVPTCIGITNQRETVVLWDRQTMAAPRPAIVWQDRRTAGMCEQLRSDGHEALVASLTGLRLDPYFTATKLAWIAANEPGIWSEVADGRVVIGTVDSYLIARMTGGEHHVTDASNASRSLLFDIHRGEWSEALCELFGVPLDALPRVVPSYGVVGATDPSSFLGLQVSISGIAGDQQAALFGQTCFDVGASKCTYGTGSFVLTNTGSTPMPSGAGLLTTVAWQAPDGTLTYAVEGAIFATGAAIQWLRDGLGLIDSSADSEPLARSVPDSAGVVMVPAFTGMAAPDWDPTARGAIFGLTRGTTSAHLTRAAIESIAFQVRDVADLMRRETALTLPSLAVDGGASANDLLCQCQADQLGIPVRRPAVIETTALGAAFLAGLGTGVWASTDELRQSWQLDAEFTPGATDERAYRRWRAAVERSKGWAAEG